MEDILIQLIKLSEEKEIPYTKKQLEKMDLEQLEKVKKEYEIKQLDEFNETMVDVTIFKIEEFMKKCNVVKEDSELGKKLQDKKLFRADVKKIISYISPMLPFIGLVEGAVCILSEVIENKKNVSPSEEESGDSGKTQQ